MSVEETRGISTNVVNLILFHLRPHHRYPLYGTRVLLSTGAVPSWLPAPCIRSL